MEFNIQSKPQLINELTRLARFGANISDSYSCFLFLPTSALRIFGANLPDSIGSGESEALHMVGVHSLSKDVPQRCVLPIDGGLIGWVAKHGRSIHVSPFDRDSRTLGTYLADQELKSFIGIPVPLDGETGRALRFGVVACDSKKAFAFSKLQGKLLEDLAAQISALFRFAAFDKDQSDSGVSWNSFLAAGNLLAEATGLGSIDVLRIKPANLNVLERAIGIPATIDLMDQVTRLVQQTLPPGTPLCRLPQGDLLIAVDNMMVSFYESRIEAIASHGRAGEHRILFEYQRPLKQRRQSATGFEELVRTQICGDAEQGEAAAGSQKGGYEYRRA